MSQKRVHSESRGKGEGNVEIPLTKPEAKKAMARFESLARQIVAVPREKLQEQQKIFQAKNAARRINQKRKGAGDGKKY